MIDEGKIAGGIIGLLEGLGIDLAHPDFVDTPKRVARMYKEMLTPQVNNWATFPAEAADLVILRGHKVIAICPHHLQPVVIHAYVGYIPDKLTVGLSKLARVVESQLTAPLMQETLGRQIADEIDEHLQPKGVAVVLQGMHGCMSFRGIESEGDVITSVMKGLFLHVPPLRAEFLQLVGRP